MKKIKDKQIKIDYSFSLFSFIRRFSGLAIILVLAWFLFKKSSKYEELLQLNEVVTEELQISKNEKGELVAKIGAFETQRTEDFIKFATKDSLTLELQKEVKNMRKYLKKQGSVTQFSSEGNVQTTTDTEVQTDPSGNPVYLSNFNLDGWVFGSSKATKDSTFYDISYKDNYSLTIGRDPQGFLGLGKSKPFAEVTSSNPYNVVKTLKTYQVSLPKPKRFSIGPNVSLTPSIENGSIKIKPTIGVGVQYNLLKF